MIRAAHRLRWLPRLSACWGLISINACGTAETPTPSDTGGTANATGGTFQNGGSPSGGLASGGLANGGSSTGGLPAATGGTSSASGGTSAGGAISASGGISTGGTSSASGGISTGGTSSASGGTSTGGAISASGGISTGGTSSASGGTSTGGKATGGTGTGGGATGGTSCATPPEPSPLVGWASQSGTTTGGGTATPTTVTTLAEFTSAASGTTARVIYVQGNFTGSVAIGSNKTVVGICGASITGHVGVSGSSNVIVRNLKIVGNNCTDSPQDCSAGADAVSITNGAQHVWFDHCDISDGSDGNLDVNAASDFVTISWTKFSYSSARTDPAAGASGHRFSNLVGSADNLTSDEGKLNVTYHHCWWANNVDQRMPRVRYGKIHVFNNLYTATGNNYCIGVGMAASVRDENNVFIGSNRPVNTTSFVDSRSTVNSIGNIYTNTTGGTPVDIGTAFTPPYAYSLDAASSVQSAVQSGAGPH